MLKVETVNELRLLWKGRIVATEGADICKGVTEVNLTYDEAREIYREVLAANPDSELRLIGSDDLWVFIHGYNVILGRVPQPLMCRCEELLLAAFWR